MSLNATVSNISRCSLHDGPGVRTVIYFTGCALNCLWCHNPETIAASGEILFAPINCVHCGRCVTTCPEHHIIEDNDMVFLRDGCAKCGKCVDACPSGALSISKSNYTVEELLKQVLKEKHYFLQNGGVTLSGGECLLQADFCAALLQKCQEQGIHTAIDTCGHAPWSAFEQTLPFCKLYLFDVKHMDSEKHREVTGQGNELILENLSRLAERGARIQIRIPLIPGINDDDENIRRTGEFLKKIAPEKIKLLPYHDMAHVKYLALGQTDTLPVRPDDMPERLHRALDIMRAMELPVYSDQ